MQTRNTYRGPAFLSHGFRPFFLFAGLFAFAVIPFWRLVWRGDVGVGGHFSPVDWHIHEMIFGYGSAVVAGFLFTAVPNWTGRMPTRGWPLAVLLVTWLAGRAAVAGLVPVGPVMAASIDQLFLLAVATMIAREIIAGRNWRNLKVLLPVSLFWGANLLFHVEALTQGVSDIGRRLGIAILIFLIMLIGGRIVPSFTRNWLAQRGSARLPVAFDRFDGASILTGAVALISWSIAPLHLVTGCLGAVAAMLHLIRLFRWRGQDTWRSPLLLMLHVAYLMVPLGLASIATGAAGIAPPGGQRPCARDRSRCRDDIGGHDARNHGAHGPPAGRRFRADLVLCHDLRCHRRPRGRAARGARGFRRDRPVGRALDRRVRHLPLAHGTVARGAESRPENGVTPDRKINGDMKEIDPHHRLASLITCSPEKSAV